MDLRAVFATNLKRIRKEAGFTQETLGQATGKHRTYIGAIERQTGNPSLKSIEDILDALNVEPFELFVDHRKCTIVPKSAFLNDEPEGDKPLYSICVKQGESYNFYPIEVNDSALDLLIDALVSSREKRSK